MHKKQRLKVLIADDEAHIRIFIKEVMHSIGAEVIGEAKDGIEAVRIFKKKKPHLVMLDVNMPGKTGEESLIEIMSEDPNALVIMLTAAIDRRTVKKCIEKGASNYIRKDTNITEMKKIIIETWNKHKASRSGNGQTI